MTKVSQQFENIVLALAGIFQAAVLVRDLAKTGSSDEQAFTTSISSIYHIDAPSVVAVYGEVAGLRVGLNELHHLLGNTKQTADPAISRYLISIIHLERKLKKNPNLINNLTRRIKYAISQANYFSAVHPTVLASLADIYVTTLGTLPFRIQVVGQAKYLNQNEVLNKVRAVLLAGVRSAVLWRQLGGKRWHLFLWRSKIAAKAKQLLT